jgi:hypothetical protein
MPVYLQQMMPFYRQQITNYDNDQIRSRLDLLTEFHILSPTNYIGIMKIRQLLLILVISAGFSERITAQNVVIENPLMNDGTGRPQVIKTNYRIEGSPFLFDEYITATLMSTDGKTLGDYDVKVNIVENKIYYKLPDGREMNLIAPVSTLRFLYQVPGSASEDSVLISAIASPINGPSAAVYVIQATGKLNLLKKISITYKDVKEYGTTNSARIFTRKETYYFSEDVTTPVKLPKSEIDLLPYFGNKQKQVQQYIAQNGLKYKSETDLIKMFKYYNSL